MEATAVWPRISAHPRVQRQYEEMRESGQSHNIAEMLATRVTPGIMSDSVFLAGHCNGNQFANNPDTGDAFAEVAAAAGVDVKGKVYLSGLAEYPGDPRAWVTGRSDVKALVEERGWDCDGAVKVKAFEPRERKEVGVADDLIDAEVDSIVASDPNPALVDREDLREQVKEKRSPHWAK